MSDQLWAIVSKRGAFRLIYTASADISPVDDGHRKECRDKAVWPLARDPKPGERIDFDTGEFIYDGEHAQPGRRSVVDELIFDIKAEAGRRILNAYPLWKQMNDMDLPADDPDVVARKEERDRIRAWSNALEARARAATSATILANIRAELAV